MFRVVIILIVFNFSVSAFGQLDNKFKNQIKLTPPKMIEYLNQGIELNYERSHATKFASELSAAILSIS